MDDYERVRAEIDLDAVRENITNLKALTKAGTKMMAVVKADGYGHGAIAVAKALRNLVDGYAVATVEEGVALREASVDKMVLILGITFPEYAGKVVSYGLSQVVSSLEEAEALSAAAVKRNTRAKVHIGLDTGMGRIGFPDKDESIDTIKKISELPGITIEGIFTHYARCDEADKTSVKDQLKRYSDFVDKVEAAGIHIPIHHASNSAGIIELPESNFDMVRSGITTYGLYPSNEVSKDKAVLKPAMRLVSHVTFVKTVPAGTGISYGSTFVTAHETKVATIPVGYADGYPRQLSNKGSVLIGGNRVPILGRVCMDQMMVDVTEISDVKPGDEVVLVGSQGNESISAEELGDLSGRFNYELVCDITARVPRVYFENGKRVGVMDYRKFAPDAIELHLSETDK